MWSKNGQDDRRLVVSRQGHVSGSAPQRQAALDALQDLAKNGVCVWRGWLLGADGVLDGLRHKKHKMRRRCQLGWVMGG